MGALGGGAIGLLALANCDTELDGEVCDEIHLAHILDRVVDVVGSDCLLAAVLPACAQETGETSINPCARSITSSLGRVIALLHTHARTHARTDLPIYNGPAAREAVA
jgi:hypothetical protein